MFWEVSWWRQRYYLKRLDVCGDNVAVCINTKLLDIDDIEEAILEWVEKELIRFIESSPTISIEKDDNLSNNIANVSTSHIHTITVILPEGDIIEVQELQLHDIINAAIIDNAESCQSPIGVHRISLLYQPKRLRITTV